MKCKAVEQMTPIFLPSKLIVLKWLMKRMCRNRKFVYILLCGVGYSNFRKFVYDKFMIIYDMIWNSITFLSLFSNRPGRKNQVKSSRVRETGIIYKSRFSYFFMLKLALADYTLDPFTLAPNIYLNCNMSCNLIHTRSTAPFMRSLLWLKKIQMKTMK